MTSVPARTARPLGLAVALVLAAGASATALPLPAAAAGDGPSLRLADSHLSGAVGGVVDQAATVTVDGHGTPVAELTVTATASSRSSVARTGDVTVTGAGATRTVSVAARGVGYTDLTLRVTAPDSSSDTATLHYAASAAVANAAETRYLSGAADASAAVDVGGGCIVVADDESNTLRLYDRDVSGPPLRSWDLDDDLDAAKEADIEGAARVGDTIYWTGSLGNNKDGEEKPDRDTLFATTVSGSGAATRLTVSGYYKGLRADLVAWDEDHGDRFGFAHATEDGQTPKQIDGFNVEGLEFAPGSDTTAYLAFRAPLVPPRDGGKALLVPVTGVDELVDGEHDGSGRAAFGEPVQLDLGGLSVRDIRRNADGQYLVLAGSWAADDNSSPYALYRWDGTATGTPVKLLDLPTADQGAWESVVDVPDLEAPGARAQLLTDDGDDDLYGDGTAAKDLEEESWQKDRAVRFPLGG